MNANMYKIGDYVYFEVSPSAPYQIRRIEELNKTATGNVEAKVMCFFRRRDISPSLLRLADKHQVKESSGSEKIHLWDDKKHHGHEKEKKIDLGNKEAKKAPITNGHDDFKTTSLENGDSMDVDDSPLGNSEDCKKEDSGGEAEETKDEKIDDDSSKSDTENGAKNDCDTKNGCDKSPPTAPVEKNGALTGPTVGLMGMEKLEPEERHRLKQRELFLTRQIETLPATHIRGKANVTLLNEMETPSTYTDKEDSFFYSLVYDPQQKTLLADKGEIRLGEKYQAQVPTATLTDDEKESYRSEKLETLIFQPSHGLSDREIDQYLIIARAVGTFSRALDSNSAAKHPSLHFSAAAASRDVTLFHVLSLLHHADYELGKAMCYLVPPPNKSLYPLEADKGTSHRTRTLGGPLLCRDQLEEWSAAEAALFEEALEKYGKDFHDIRQDFLPWKSLRDIVEYYYMWKTTDRYLHQKRAKAIEAEGRLKQVYIPGYNRPDHPAALNSRNAQGQPVSCGKSCESCAKEKAVQWYIWGPNHLGLRLCQGCWNYWKRYGGLLKVHNLDTYDKDGEATDSAASTGNELKCVECKKIFDSAEKLQQHKAAMHPVMRCPVNGCMRECSGKLALHKHLSLDHGIPTPSFPDISSGTASSMVRNGPKTPRAPFFLHTNLLTRIARRIVPKNLLSARRNGRNPFMAINVAQIKAFCHAAPETQRRKVAVTITQRAKKKVNETTPVKNVTLPNGVSNANRRKRALPNVRVDEGPDAKKLATEMRNSGDSMASEEKQYISWIKTNQDCYFRSTPETKVVRKKLSSEQVRNLARRPEKSESLADELLFVTGK